MPERIVGQVKRVNGPVITIKGITDAMMMELVQVGEQRLVGEVVKLDGQQAIVQVYEEATGIAPSDNVYGTGMPLSVELEPGLIGTIYDGIQRPLERLRDLGGDTIQRGLESPSIDRKKEWEYLPLVTVGDTVTPGQTIGTVQETERVEHRILVPPKLPGSAPYTVVETFNAGLYTVTTTVCTIENLEKERITLSMMQRWPIRVPRPVLDRKPLSTSWPLSTRHSKRKIPLLGKTPWGK